MKIVTEGLVSSYLFHATSLEYFLLVTIIVVNLNEKTYQRFHTVTFNRQDKYSWGNTLNTRRKLNTMISSEFQTKSSELIGVTSQNTVDIFTTLIIYLWLFCQNILELKYQLFILSSVNAENQKLILY